MLTLGRKQMMYAQKKIFCEDFQKAAHFQKYLFSTTESMKNYLAARIV